MCSTARAQIIWGLIPFINVLFNLGSIYNTLSKNPKNTTDNEFKCKINYFSITEREKNPKESEKNPKESEPQQNNTSSFVQNPENTSKNSSSIKTNNIYQTNNPNTTNNVKTPGLAF